MFDTPACGQILLRVRYGRSVMQDPNSRMLIQGRYADLFYLLVSPKVLELPVQAHPRSDQRVSIAHGSTG